MAVRSEQQIHGAAHPPTFGRVLFVLSRIRTDELGNTLISVSFFVNYDHSVCCNGNLFSSLLY